MPTLGERVYEKLLLAYPADFRQEYGAELYRAFTAHYRQTRGLQRARIWTETVADLFRTAFEEHSAMILRDLHFAARRLRGYPTAAALAVLSLALAIGAVTTIFSIVYTTLWRPAPYPAPDRLVTLLMQNLKRPDQLDGFSTADFIDLRDQSRSFSYMGLGGARNAAITLTGREFAERITAEYASPETFDMLGAKPAAGRFFTATDLKPGGEPVVLSYEFWERKFAKDTAIISQTLMIEGDPRPVTGVAPPGFRIFGSAGQVDVFTAVNLHSANWIQREARWLRASARLKDGVTLAQARAEVAAIAGRLAQSYPATNQGWTMTVDPWDAVFRRGLANTLYPLFGAVTFVLLIACANVSNLLLARAAQRRREISLRAALGAGRGRLLRELLSDGLILAIPAGLFGILIAAAGIRLILSLAPNLPLENEIGMNPAVLLFTLTVALATALVAGGTPAWLASRADLGESLKDGGRGSTGGGIRSRLRSGMVVLQIGLAMLLLVGAGLMIVSFRKLQTVDAGFEPDGMVTVDFGLSGARYSKEAPKRELDMRYIEPPVAAYYNRALELAQATPGVESASVAALAPLVRFAQRRKFTFAGRAAPAPADRPSAFLNMVMGDYLATFRIPMRAGRFLNDNDRESTEWACVVNEAFVRRFFETGDNPLGKYLVVQTVQEERPRQIVGVIADTRQFIFDDNIQPEIYTSYWQQSRIYPGSGQGVRLRPLIALRTSLPATALEDLRKKLAAIDPEQPVAQWQTVRSQMDRRANSMRFFLTLMSVFAGVALLLASMGIYAVMSNAVVERAHEIGIRMALGATRRDVLGMILSHGALLCAIGIPLGTAASAAFSRSMRLIVFGVEPTDPAMLATVAAVLASAAMAACAAPAIRATRVDPAVALRRE